MVDGIAEYILRLKKRENNFKDGDSYHLCTGFLLSPSSSP